MSTAITKSSYGYWVDADANVHPVVQAQEHSGVAHRLLGAAFEQALALKWVRVSVYATDGMLYFEHDPQQPTPLISAAVETHDSGETARAGRPSLTSCRDPVASRRPPKLTF